MHLLLFIVNNVIARWLHDYTITWSWVQIYLDYLDWIIEMTTSQCVSNITKVLSRKPSLNFIRKKGKKRKRKLIHIDSDCTHLSFFSSLTLLPFPSFRVSLSYIAPSPAVTFYRRVTYSLSLSLSLSLFSFYIRGKIMPRTRGNIL